MPIRKENLPEAAKIVCGALGGCLTNTSALSLIDQEIEDNHLPTDILSTAIGKLDKHSAPQEGLETSK